MDYAQLVNYFNGHADEEERQQVEAWKQEHSEDFARWEKVWHEAKGLVEVAPPDLKKGWKQVQGAINTAPKAKSRTLSWGLKIAATITALLLAGSAFYLTSSVSVEAMEENAYAQLPDGSEVWLYKGSSINYPRFFWGRSERNVSMKGEVYFQIQRNEEKSFVVRSELTEVKVLGTSFLVKNQGSEHRVQVSSGKVAFYPKDNEKSMVFLEKGDEGIYLSGNLGLVKQTIQDPNFLAWKDQEMYFDEAPLSEVVRVIKKVYGVEIQKENSDWEQCKLTASFSQKPLEDVLKTLETIYELDIEQDENHGLIKISGEACE